MANFYVSDLHFGHANIMNHSKRNFKNVDEMDQIFIDNWNSVITDKDDVWILGDFSLKSHKNAIEYLRALKGKKHLIRGNHDRDWIKKVDLSKFFVSNENLSFISDGKHRITVCHYPMMSWPHMSTNGYMVFGHIHHNTDAVYWPIIEQSELMLNAGVDINGFMPVTFEEMVENNVNHKIKTASHRIVRENLGLFTMAENLKEKVDDLLPDE